MSRTAEPQPEGGVPPPPLIIEPDIIVRSELSECLRDCDYRVIEVATGNEAMLILAASGERIAVLLVDAAAPGTPSCFGLAKWGWANAVNIDVILTGTLEQTTKEAGGLCKDGPAPPKPYDSWVVLDRIRRLIATRDRRGAD